MKRSAVCMFAALAAVAALVGCGGNTATPTSQTPASPTSQAPAQQLADQIAAAAWQYMSKVMDSGDGPVTFGPNYPCDPSTTTVFGTQDTCWPRYLTKFWVQHDPFPANLYTLTACLSVGADASNRYEIGEAAVRGIWGHIKTPLAMKFAPSILATNIDAVDAVDADGGHIVSNSDLDPPH